MVLAFIRPQRGASRFQRIAKVSPGWSAGYTLYVEAPGPGASVGLTENQFNDDAWLWNSINPPSGLTLNTLLSYAWITSDKWGTLNWGLLSPATDNVGLLPDLSGTILEENAVLFVGFGMFVRPSGLRVRWGNCDGRIAVESSMLQMRTACRPLELLTTSQTTHAPS